MSDEKQPLEEGTPKVNPTNNTSNTIDSIQDSAALESSDDTAAIENTSEILENQTSTSQENDAILEEPITEIANKPEEEKVEEEVDEIESSDEENNETKVSETKEKVDYSNLSKEELISTLKELLENNKVQDIKEDAEEIKTEFNTLFQEELAEKKEIFLAEGGNIIDFHYTSNSKKEFNDAFNEYRTKRSAHFKKLKQDLESNLEIRNALIDEIKALVSSDESVNKNYKKIKDIQDRWREAGAIPRDKYNTVWNNYHHHMENYYDALHLDREFRDLDFKHNLEEKQKLIKRTQELGQESDINKAFRELQLIHRRWKEEIGPVAREIREDIWDTFSAATKIIHDKKMQAEAALEETFHENFSIKKELIGLIDKVKQETTPSHKNWQQAMKQVQEIRDVFFQAGKVPRDKNKDIWASFKDATRSFNKAKNDFYKHQKTAQFENLEKKNALIQIAEDNKDTEDFVTATPLFKKIQHDWRDIGHVPRKESDVVWNKFKAACNHYFDRLHALKDEENKEELVNFEKKEALLSTMQSLPITGDHKEDINAIKAKISEWKAIGRVPFKKKSIDQKFNKALDTLFSKLDLDKKEAELIKFENKITAMVSQKDDRQLQNEQFFIGKKIDETKSEILQLENNLEFFKHVKEDNPLVKDVYKNIARHKEQLEIWKEKLKKIKTKRNV